MNLNVQLNWNIALSSPLIIKICKVHGELTKEQIYFIIRHDRPNGCGYRKDCRQCHAIRVKKSYFKDVNKSRKKSKEKNSIEKYREMRRQASQRNIKEITDSYVRDVMKITKYDAIPPELIELKRITLKLKRELRTHGQK